MVVTQLKGSYLDIAAQLGLRRDEILYLASDITRLALKARRDGERFTADEWIGSFLRAMPHGTLVVPAFTDDLRSGDHFDRAASKPTTGAVSNKVMRRTDVVRTSDPLHSVFAMGRLKDEIAALSDPSTFGPDSIFGYLHRRRAKMLILDVDLQHSFTFIHYLEELWKMPYRRHVEMTIHVKGPEGSGPRTVKYYAKRIGVRNDLHRYQHDLQEQGVVRSHDFEGIPVLFMDLDEVAEWTRTYFAQGGRVHSFSWVEVMKTMTKQVLSALGHKR